jgi:hypothetical protein
VTIIVKFTSAGTNPNYVQYANRELEALLFGKYEPYLMIEWQFHNLKKIIAQTFRKCILLPRQSHYDIYTLTKFEVEIHISNTQNPPPRKPKPKPNSITFQDDCLI